MSEAADHDDAADEFDLSDIPMDDDDAISPGDEGEGDEADAAKKAADAAKAADKAPLEPAELERRHASTKVALATERAKRRELERRLSALEGGEERQPARQPARAEAPEAEIDPDVDPMGALKQMRAKIAAYEKAEQLDQQTDAQRQAQERTFASVESALSEHETDFREDHPDYDDAAKHYAVTRAQELMSFGLQPAQIQPMLREEFVKLTQAATRAGKNPAAVVYEMAKGRGYGAKKAEDPPADPKAPKDKGKLDALQRGARAGSPLGGSGGRATTGLDAVTVANINIHDKKGAEAFDKAFEALERQARRAERGR